MTGSRSGRWRPSQVVQEGGRGGSSSYVTREVKIPPEGRGTRQWTGVVYSDGSGSTLASSPSTRRHVSEDVLPVPSTTEEQHFVRQTRDKGQEDTETLYSLPWVQTHWTSSFPPFKREARIGRSLRDVPIGPVTPSPLRTRRTDPTSPADDNVGRPDSGTRHDE